jgi:hypothetical protein
LTQKLSFTISNAELVNENPDSSFALLSLDFFASGKNKHDTYVSEETLLKTADTIKNCPVVWKYDPILDDIGTHDPEEAPCGFIPQDTEIKSRKMDDGRTMLSVLSYVWKRYSGKLLDFFKRDGEKPVSVEMNVLDSAQMQGNLIELKDYRFEAVTVLGTFVTPAIPMAKATVLQFSKEYKDAYNKEFAKYEGIDFAIPEDVKKNVQMALELHHSNSIKATSVSLAMAEYLATNEKVTPTIVRQMVKFFSKPVDTRVNFFGGKEGALWSKDIFDAIEKIDSSQSYFGEGGLLTMPYKNVSEINPALKGITPPITLGQANEIAKQADAVGTTDKVNGWAVAISSFKKTHKVVDGKWVKKNKEESMSDKEKEEMAEEVKPKEEMAEEEKLEAAAPEEKGEDPEEEKTESPEEEKKEDKEEKMEAEPDGDEMKDKPSMKRMSLDAYLDVAAMLAYLEAETDDNAEMVAKYAEAKEEMAKEYCNPASIMSAMYAKMCKLSAKFAKQEEEMAQLRKYKADAEANQKKEEVEMCLKEMAEKVVIPDETMAEMRASAEKFSYAEIDAWKNECKAKVYDFAVKQPAKGEEKIVRMGLPFTTKIPAPQNDIWAGTKKD